MAKEHKKTKSSKHLEVVVPPEEEPVQLKSYCGINGPWDQKKISIFGAVRSVISQLRYALESFKNS